MVVGVALDVEGRPICCEMWPGNTADAKSLLPVVERMRAKFRVREMCVVVDRGMVSEATSKPLGGWIPVHYIVGVRMRRTKEVGEVVLKSRARWQEVTPERRRAKDPAPLKVKEVEVRAAVTSSVSTRRSGERTPRTARPSSRPCASNCAVATRVSLETKAIEGSSKSRVAATLPSTKCRSPRKSATMAS